MQNSGCTLEIRYLTKGYYGVTAVDNISFTIGRGEVLGQLGPNGSGKSTTMKILIGLPELSDGSIMRPAWRAGALHDSRCVRGAPQFCRDIGRDRYLYPAS